MFFDRARLTLTLRRNLFFYRPWVFGPGSRRGQRKEPLTSLKFPSKNKSVQKGSLAEIVEPALILLKNIPEASDAMKGVYGSGSKWHTSP